MNANQAYDIFRQIATLYNYTEVTMYDYRREFHRFYEHGTRRYGADWDIRSTSPQDVHHYMACCIADGKSAASVNRSRDALSSLFRALTVSGDMTSNPVEQIRAIRYARRARAILDEEHATRLIDSISNPTIQLAVRLMYYTGVRVGELVTLSVRHFNLDDGVLTVVGKGRKQRTIPLHKEELLPFLREYHARILRDASEYALFLQSKQSRQLSPTVLNHVLREVSAALGATVPVTCHVLRHSFATQYLYNGGYLHELQYLLGHNHIETTARYLHVDLESIRFRIDGNPRQGAESGENIQ